MKLIVLACMISCAVAASLDHTTSKPVVRILKQSKEFAQDGSYNYNFESEDGVRVNAAGSQKRIGPKPEDVGNVARGSYSYTSREGRLITVNWVADENGFQATGDHLPVAPPAPDHVVKLLADLRAAGRL